MMELESYKTKLDGLEKSHHEKVRKLQLDYAMSNSAINEGDIVTDHCGKVRVVRVCWTVLNGEPICVYRGKELTKAGKPRKDKSMRDVYQINIKGE